MPDERDTLIAPLEPIASPGERLSRHLASIGVRFLERDHEPTYRCWVCQDTGYTSREKPDKFGDLCSMASPCEGSDERPCLGGETKPSGLAIEAGLWARALPSRTLPSRRGETAWRPEVAARYATRLQSHPHGLDLRAAVDRALASSEKA